MASNLVDLEANYITVDLSSFSGLLKDIEGFLKTGGVADKLCLYGMLHICKYWQRSFGQPLKTESWNGLLPGSYS